jgi:hypothetical protein
MWIVNKLFYLFTIHIRKEKLYSAYSTGDKKWLIIVIFAYSDRDALTIYTRRKKKNYFVYSAEDEKWLIIVKYDYYEPFAYSVGGAREHRSTDFEFVFLFLFSLWALNVQIDCCMGPFD